MPRPAVIVRGIAPRGLTRAEAAAYLGIDEATYSDWQRKGIVPGPIPGTTRYDRKAIDLHLDRASGIAAPSAGEDEWMRRVRS